MTAVTISSRANSHSQQMIYQAISLCRRHQQPLSLLAVELQELASLKADIGAGRIDQLLTRVRQQLHMQKRCEDALVSCQAGRYLFIVLPATTVNGAVAMAKRLQQWFSRQEFELDEFRISLPANIAIHCASLTQEERVADLFNTTMAVLAGASGDATLTLSDYATQQLSDSRPTDDPASALSRDLLELARSGQSATLLEVLSPTLSTLDETLRLKLVDHLLEASTRAQAC